jgi:hypothetical protein
MRRCAHEAQLCVYLNRFLILAIREGLQGSLHAAATEDRFLIFAITERRRPLLEFRDQDDRKGKSIP